jgi:hypothetical protein
MVINQRKQKNRKRKGGREGRKNEREKATFLKIIRRDRKDIQC